MDHKTDRIQWALTLLSGLCLIGVWATFVTRGALGSAQTWAIVSVVCGAYFALKSAFQSIRERSLDVNLLMVLAAAGAIAVGHTEDAAVLLFLFSLGSALEALTMAKTRNAIEALVKLRPAEAIRVSGGTDERVAVEDLEPGDTVRVLPFEPVPADGVLISERAQLNQSAMTGESIPVERRQGATLMAGTQNLDSMILFRVSHRMGETSLDRIVALVEEAQENKASGERISKWFGERYTIFVLVAFLVSILIRVGVGAPFSEAFYLSLILLVALSPCALVISSPAASLSALAFAARRGILVRGGEYMEQAGRITMIACDKTGTLTEGNPKVTEICVFDPVAEIACWHQTETMLPKSREVLALAVATEQFSTHPIAEAVVAFGKHHVQEIPTAEGHRDFPGLGVEAAVDGRAVRVGQLKFFDPAEMPEDFVEHVTEMRSRGITAVLVNQGTTWGAIGLRDEPRTEAREFLAGLTPTGVRRVAMLTGDNHGTARAVAEELGITEIHAELMPADKNRLIEEWRASGERVMMMGDGVNDAPALASADLGVAMGGLGSEVALRAADVVLVQDRIVAIPTLLRLGRLTNRIIRANLVFAAGVIVMLTFASFFLNLPLPLAVIGHEGSTVLVILNGLRLLRGP